MIERSITVAISELAYVRAQHIAMGSTQPTERLLSQFPEAVFDEFVDLSADEQAKLAALQHLSDAALWVIAAEQMPRIAQERLSLLLALNKRVSLTESEVAELNTLFANGDRLMLRKAEAAAILTKRGHTVTPKDMRRTDR
jgi:hypothetical protein